MTTDRRTNGPMDRRTDTPSYRDATAHLKRRTRTRRQSKTRTRKTRTRRQRRTITRSAECTSLEKWVYSYISFSHFQFLDAPSHLYKRVCPSVRPSVRRSVGPSGRRSVTPSLRRVLGASYAEYSALFLVALLTFSRMHVFLYTILLVKFVG